jgi:hypothetical protein
MFFYTMKVTGHCFCQAIRFRAEIDEEAVMLCHCPDCQHFTGTAFRAIAPAPGATFELLSGEPTRYIKVKDDGSRRVHAFCSTCGSSVYSCADEAAPAMYRLRVGTLTPNAGLTPKFQQWCSTALPWALVPGIPSADESFG